MYECARFLAGRGHEVTVYAREFESEQPGVTHRRVNVPRVPGFLIPSAFHTACTDAMREREFDVHGAFGCDSPNGGVFWAQSVHAAWLDKAKAFRSPWSPGRWKQRLNPVHPVLLRLEKGHYQRGNYRKIVALTPEVRADLRHYYGVPEEDIVIVPNGFAPDEFNLSNTERLAVRRRLGFQDGQKVIVFVGNELERKGYPALLRAVEILNDRSLRLLVVGKMKPAAHRLVTYAEPTSKVAQYYAAGNVFALPTQYEAWGMVIVEAMACGLPVLTSRLAGAAVAVREGVTGELLDDPKSAPEIATKLRLLLDGKHAGREEIAASVACYDWSRVLTRYEQVLIDSVGAKAAGSFSGSAAAEAR